MTSKTRWTPLEKQERTHMSNSPVLADQQRHGHQLCADSGYHLEDFPKVGLGQMSRES